MTTRRPSAGTRRLGMLLTGAAGLISVLVLAWGYWPAARQVSHLRFQPGESTAAFISYVRAVELSYPSRIRVEDPAFVELRVQLANHSGAPSISRPPATADDDSAEAPAVGEARLELPRAVVRPPEAISEPLPSRESLSFMWQIIPQEPGAMQGTAWLVLIPQDERASRQVRIAVSAQPVEIEAQTLLGMSGPDARLMGAVGVVTGLIGFLALLRHDASSGESSGMARA